MVRLLLPVLLLCGCKPTCPPADLECLVASMELHDVSEDLSEPGIKLELTDVPTATLEADQVADNQAGGANANGKLGLGVLGQPSFTSNVAEGILFFTFSDPHGQRPGICFTPCPKNARCLGTSRCTGALRDGLTSGTGWFRLGFKSQPAEPPGFGYTITPIVDPAGGNPAGQLLTGAGVVTGLSDTVRVNLPGPGNTGAGGGGGTGGSGGGGTAAGGGGGSSTCLTASTLNCTPAGSGGLSSTCITAAEYSADTGGGSLPATCAPSGTTGCMNSNLALVKPCCPGLTCKVGSACGGGSTFGGVCN